MQYIEKKKVDKKMMGEFPGKYNLMDLSRMLTYPRPAGSQMEEKYIAKFIDIVPGIRKDAFGNRFVTIGKKPTTMFASHTDTVHRYSLNKDIGKPDFRNIIVEGRWARGKKDILGADDTTGNWLMLNLISEKKPGLYVFHREEEQGRGGSEWIAEYRPEFLKGIKRVVSFDRKGYEDIITHQLGERSASDKFAKELAKRLGGGFKPDPSGSFTDSASYTHLVPECTNISVGYKHAHSSSEKQNLRFAKHLYMKLRSVDFETLPVVRKPVEREEAQWVSYPSGYGSYGTSDSGWWNQPIRYPQYKKNIYKTKVSRRDMERLAISLHIARAAQSNVLNTKPNFEGFRRHIRYIYRNTDLLFSNEEYESLARAYGINNIDDYPAWLNEQRNKKIEKENEQQIRKLFASTNEYNRWLAKEMRKKKREGMIE